MLADFIKLRVALDRTAHPSFELPDGNHYVIDNRDILANNTMEALKLFVLANNPGLYVKFHELRQDQTVSGSRACMQWLLDESKKLVDSNVNVPL